MSEHVYCVASTFKMTEGVEQQFCIKFCVKLEHSSMGTIGMTQKAAAMANLCLAASSRQRACSCITSCTEFFGKTPNHPGDSACPLQLKLAPCDFWFFLKLKSLEREETSDHRRDSGEYDGVADGVWENCVRSQGTYFEGD